MAAAVDLELDDKQVREFFSDLTRRLGQATRAEKVYADGLSIFVFQDVMDHFAKESGPQGEWQEWSDSYTEQMNRIGRGGNEILQFSGRLRQSFTPSQYRKAQGGLEWYNPAKTKDGYPYAFAHNEGDGRLPQREFMWLSDKALGKIGEFTLNYVLGEKNG